MASNIVLGSAPNWYCSRVCDSNGQYIVAYGARNLIVVIDIKPKPPKYLTIIPAHKFRVTALSFCSKRPAILATGSEDGVIKAWDIFKKKYFYEFKNEEKIFCIEWQEGTDQVIFASTEQGNIFLLDLLHNDARNLKFGMKSPAIVLASCPSKPNLLATGHKGGAVVVLDVSQSSIVHKLKGHEDDILSLSWRATHEEQLVSTSRDRTLRVWNVSVERPAHILFVPQSSPRGGKGDDYRLRPWLCTICLPDGKLVTSTFSGNLILWNLESEEKQKWVALQTKDAGGHNKCVFTICSTDPDGKKLCTISLDRQIILWDLEMKKSEYVLPTLGGFAFCLSFSPVDVGRLAVGSGDQCIRIWNASSRSSTALITTLWQGIKGKVTTVAWHPEKEGQLAFGTDEGKIGAFDILSPRPPAISSTYHKRTVYTVTWGPCVINQEGSNIPWYLYSCGDGVILIHNISQPQLEAVNLDDLLNKSSERKEQKRSPRTEIAWKPDFTVFAVGNDDGSIEIYRSKDFNLLARLLVQKKQIQNLSWHPLYTAVSSEQSSMHMWLASASTDAAVHVFDLSDILASEEIPATTVTRSTRQLVGHRCRVVSLAWNPHVEGRLASASYDETVQVWDAVLGQPIANYRGHQGRVYCIEWNLFDSDIIFSGGEDCMVHQWKVSEQLHNLPPTKQAAAKLKKNLSNINGNLASKQANLNGSFQETAAFQAKKLHDVRSQENEDDEIQEVLQDIVSTTVVNTKESTLQDFNTQVTNDADHLYQESTIKIKKVDTFSGSGKKPGKGDNKKKKKMKSLFPVAATTECRGKSFTQDDLKFLANYFLSPVENSCPESVTNDVAVKTEDNMVHLGLFMDQEATLRMLSTEVNHHQEVDNNEYAHQLGVWTSDIGNVVNKAAEKDELSDWLVSLTPLASYAVWQETCKKYASQLVREGNYHKAVLYLLGCHEVYEAIQVLKEHVSYRDALALAKVRLPPSDPVIHELLSGWAKRADRDGNYDLAAKCYLAQKDPMGAAKVLIKRSDPSSSRLAAYIARLCGNIDEANVYSLSCLKESLLKHDWAVAKDMISEQPLIQDFNILISIHEALTAEDKKITNNINTFGFQGIPTLKDGFSNEVIFWKKYLMEDLLFLPYLFNLLEAEGHLQAENSRLIECYEAIRSLSVQSHPHTDREMMFHLAVDLSLSILATFILDKSLVFYHIAHAVKTCYNASCMSVLNTIFIMLIPSDLIWQTEEDQVTEGKVIFTNTNKESHMLSSIFCEMLTLGFSTETFLLQKFTSESFKNTLVSQDLTLTALSEMFQSIVESLPKNFDVFLLMAYFCVNLLETFYKGADTIVAGMKCLVEQNFNISAKNSDTQIVVKDSNPQIELTNTFTEECEAEHLQVKNVGDMKDKINGSASVINELDQFLCTGENQIQDSKKCTADSKTFHNMHVESSLSNSYQISDTTEKKDFTTKPLLIDRDSIEVEERDFHFPCDSTVLMTDSVTDEQSAIENLKVNNDVGDESKVFTTSPIVEHSDVSGFQLYLTQLHDNNGLSLIDNVSSNLNMQHDVSDSLTEIENVSQDTDDSSNSPTNNNTVHSDCVRNSGLILFLLQKCHTFLLCDVCAFYYCLKNRLKTIEVSLASIKVSERISENCEDRDSSLTESNAHFKDIGTEGCITTADDTTLCGLQEEYHTVASYIKKLDERVKGITPPNPVSSAVKLITVYQALLEACDCDVISRVLQENISSVGKWAHQFAVNDDDVKMLNRVLLQP